jgi:hypothetical protein
MTEVHAESFEVQLAVGPEVVDITERIEAVVTRSGVSTGLASAGDRSPHRNRIGRGEHPRIHVL